MSLNEAKCLTAGLNWEGFREKSLKIKYAVKSAGKSLKSLEKSLNSTILTGFKNPKGSSFNICLKKEYKTINLIVYYKVFIYDRKFVHFKLT